jgi:tetratricopeptide (TPR) repeat protein
MAWGEILKMKETRPKILFILGAVLSLWLCVSAQVKSTAPYPSALGFEDPLKRLKRNYLFDLDTYCAYRDIEDNSSARDKVLAFGVYQTYPLQRTTFVDFFWKKPIFLKWASSCRTAEQLANILRKEGVGYFLYQKNEAMMMSAREKEFQLSGMSTTEYIRFWRFFMEPMAQNENTFAYRVLSKPRVFPVDLVELPGLQEKFLYAAEKASVHGQLRDAYETALLFNGRYPSIASSWEERAVLESLLEEYPKAIASAKRAMALDRHSLALYGVLSRSYEGLHKVSEARQWMAQAVQLNLIGSKKAEKALAYYRNGK